MAYEVRLKSNHPTGNYRRGGVSFSAATPIVLEKISKKIKDDAWLIVTEVPPAAADGSISSNRSKSSNRQTGEGDKKA